MLILIVVATGFAAFTSQDMRTSQATYEQNETYFLAEAGIDYGLFLLKHSMLVFPNPPATWVDGRAQPLYDADLNYWTQTGGTLSSIYGFDKVGVLINGGTASGGQENVVISDLSVPTSNWMSAVRTCGTFLLKYSVAETPLGSRNYTITFTSTGYIKQVPSNIDPTAIDATSGLPIGFNTVGASNWTILAQRTLQAVVNVNNPTYPVTGPATITSVQVKTFNERFR